MRLSLYSIQNNIQNNSKKISFCNKPKTFNTDAISRVYVPNIHITGENGVRGESLSRKCNKKYVSEVKNCGIEQIIDLKTADYSPKFEEFVVSQGLKYNHYPIDSEIVPAREIIDSLPELFEKINNGNFYISCAQGLHRTDIAMCLNYFFNPKADIDPPILYGHRTSKGLRFDDIFKRINSVYKALTDQDKKKLGLENFDEEDLKSKKAKLIEFNS